MKGLNKLYLVITEKILYYGTAVVLGMLIFAAGSQVQAAEPKVIVLDPACDEAHTGAVANGLDEVSENLKVARYCMQKLNKYDDVKVYITRNHNACPYSNITENQCDRNRAYYAKNVSADALVRIQMDSSQDKSQRGMTITYPNTNYSLEDFKTGYWIASAVHKRLTALGINDRGSRSVNSLSGLLYPDGSRADSDTLIRSSKLSGFPAIIIKHAFLSNIADIRTYLNNEEMLKRLGEADAKGIADYYGLHCNYTQSDLTIVSEPNEKATEYHIEAQGIEQCHSVQIAVWSLENGQDDLHWYHTNQDKKGNWNCDAIIKEYRTEGNYAIHVYITKKDGTQYYVGSSSFEVKSISSVEKLTITEYDRQTGAYTLEVEGLYAYSGISKAELRMYSLQNLVNTITYSIQEQENGTCLIRGNVKDCNAGYEKYWMEIYIEDANGISKQVGKTSLIYVASQPIVSATVSIKRGYFDLKVDNIPYPDTQTKLELEVRKEGEEAWKTYSAKTDGSGTWQSSIYFIGEETFGKYEIRGYMTGYDGVRQLVGDNSFEVNESNIGVITPGDINMDGDVTLDDVTIALKAAISIITLTGGEFLNADVNNDNDITLTDVTIILKKAIGIL